MHIRDVEQLGDDEQVEIWEDAKQSGAPKIEMGESETEDWAYDWIHDVIKAATTDAQIKDLVIEFEEEANCQGGTLDCDFLGTLMKLRRQDLRNEESKGG